MTKQHPRTIVAKEEKRHVFALPPFAAGNAKSVAVTGSFCGWTPEGRLLKHEGNGTWECTLTLPPGRYEYRFLVDGIWCDDPACADRVPNPFGSENCVSQT